MCKRDVCKPASTWICEGLPFGPHAGKATTPGLPPWTTWTIADVGAAAAASVILWRAGVFDRTEPGPNVIYEGSHLESLATLIKSFQPRCPLRSHHRR